MSARDNILKRLRGQMKGIAPPPVWSTRRQYHDLPAQFQRALTAAGGEVHHAPHLTGAVNQLIHLLRQMGASRVVLNDEPPLSHLDLSPLGEEIEWFVVGQSTGDLRAFCAAADVGLSGAGGALAETGSIIIRSGPHASRLATLLPAVHIALVPTSQLTTDIFTWTAARQGAPPANITIVSGPSKTGDIEQTLSTGVHGPKRFIVLLYEE
jgi:L-lactate utilization protein LutC